MRKFKGHAFTLSRSAGLPATPWTRFVEIYDHTTNLAKKEKSDLFKEFRYHLFKLDPKRNHNLEKIWLYDDIPEKILEELDLPSKDKGIDLLARIDGNYYAIQCKFHQDPDCRLLEDKKIKKQQKNKKRRNIGWRRGIY